MKRLTESICGYPHGAEGKDESSLTGNYCRGCFEATAIVDRLAAIEDILGNEYDLQNISYLPEQDKTTFEAGQSVWIVERDDFGDPCDVCGFVFIAEVAGKVIVSASINGSSDIDEILEEHVEQTAEEYTCDLSVYPADDCFSTKDAAEAVLEESEDE